MLSFSSTHRPTPPRVPGILLICASLLCLAWGARDARAASLSPSLQRKVAAATFEVVAAKPVDDPLTYEKPLPLDLLPYRERTDKYYSIGTAFAIGNSRYVTAAHVFGFLTGGLWGEPLLRDSGGNLYPIAQIEKFSEHEDFVVFTLAREPARSVALDVDTKPRLNEPVYTAGDALGEGGVIRDGLYTSNTPEDENGRWEWIRFSAAASPGNSGGPLLDGDGKVIGVVLMKSPNENLNYAVSIKQVLDAPDRLARIDKRQEIRLAIFDKVKAVQFKQEFALPKSFGEFSATLSSLRNEIQLRGIGELLADDADSIFPRGHGSDNVLHRTYEHFAPALVTRGRNGTWVFNEPHQENIVIDRGGWADTAISGRLVLQHLHAPDGVDPTTLYDDPAAYMRLALKGMFLTRQVGTESVKITSLGKPAQDSAFTDTWGRRWQLRVWPLAFINGSLVSLDLPVPDGYVSLRMQTIGGVPSFEVASLRALADFVAVSYGGTLAQWQAFLNLKTWTPPALSSSSLHVEYGRVLNFQSAPLAFSVTPDLEKIAPESFLRFDFGFYPEAGKIAWGLADVGVRGEREDKTEVGAYRYRAPDADSDDGYRRNWEKRLHREHPFDAVAAEEKDRLYIRTNYGKADATTQPDVLYTFVYRADTGTPQDVMKKKLDLFMKDARVTEH